MARPSLPLPVVASSSLGALGRFGNQLLQYGFLRLYAARHGLALETSPWVGRELFACREPPVSPARPVLSEMELGVFDADFLGRPAAEGFDLWGWFQVDARTLAPQRDLFRSLFRLRPELASAIDEGASRLRARGRSLVGIHLRRGDYRPATGHPLVDRLYESTPAVLYREWLERLWPTLDKPVLFLASDEPEELLAEFAEFSPHTSSSLGLEMPRTPYLPDFFLLARCAALAISNSTFSFAAALLAEPESQFVRPSPECAALETFHPWASPPHLAADPARALEKAEPDRFRAEVALQFDLPVELSLSSEPQAQPVRAILSGRPHRGWLTLSGELSRGHRTANLLVRWRDADDAAASFEFASRDQQLFHADEPPNFAGLGEAQGARLEGPTWSLLAAAAIPGHPGELFVVLTLLASGPHSFFIEMRCPGAVRRPSP